MRSSQVLIFILFIQLNAECKSPEVIRIIKAGIDISIDKKWSSSDYITNTFGKKLGFEQILVPSDYTNEKQLENWRAVKVDFQNDSTRNSKAICSPHQNTKNVVNFKLNGFECVFKIIQNSKNIFIAVKKITKNIRTPASKKTPFVRYVTFVEQNSESIEEFKNWISKTKEIQ